MKCPACGTGYSRDCSVCRERTYRITPLKIIGDFPWKVHVLVWNTPEMARMHCENCGLDIKPEMTMRELTGPCSAGKQVEVK
jgi:transcription elongation factor Elf1